RRTYGKDATVDYIRYFDITFLSGKNKLEPNDFVNISIVYDEPITVGLNTHGATAHFAEDGIEMLATDIAATDKNTPRGSADTFTFSSDSFSVVAPMSVTSTTETGTFYQRVTNKKADGTTYTLEVGEVYMIVSAQGYFALRNNGGDSNNGNSLDVTLKQVRGNEDYYYAPTLPATENIDSLLWTWNGTTFVNGSTYLRLNDRGGVNAVLQTVQGNAVTCTYIESTSSTTNGSTIAPLHTWTIRNDTRYLNNTGTGSFTRGGVADDSGSGMLILKQVEKTLTIPDVISGPIGSDEDDIIEKDSTWYDADTNSISDSKAQDLTHKDIPEDMQNENGTLEWAYYSDAATSDIENGFTATGYGYDNLSEAGYKEVTRQDGMVSTDKSVIYNDDDYSAIKSYDFGEFGVTLSVIGQDYMLQERSHVNIPLDVMFVLDTSSSMVDNNASGSTKRQTAALQALNDAMALVLNDNSENRVGVALYSSNSAVLMPLGKYSLPDSAFD
ncbi:MAG: VWA domain-containing protein, partial [Oscillospiraceae bacterium]|nr:VWA domain-containing protein [Oscillospiraceae bacterium]